MEQMLWALALDNDINKFSSSFAPQYMSVLNFSLSFSRNNDWYR